MKDDYLVNQLKKQLHKNPSPQLNTEFASA